MESTTGVQSVSVRPTSVIAPPDFAHPPPAGLRVLGSKGFRGSRDMKRMTSPALYADRNDAARVLLRMLEEFKGADPLVLAIPRGGVPIGAIIANGLGGRSIPC